MINFNQEELLQRSALSSTISMIDRITKERGVSFEVIDKVFTENKLWDIIDGDLGIWASYVSQNENAIVERFGEPS